jgi:hypothetical protein
MFKMKLQKVLLPVCLLLYIVSPIYGAGRLTGPGQINISMVRIGQTYSFKKISGFYYEVTNYIEDGLKLGIEPIIPSRNKLASTEFEPIPDISWVKLEKEKFILKYGEKASTNFYLTIPDDPKYMGKKYQFNLRVYTIDYPQSLSLTTQILLTISEERISLPELIEEMGLDKLKFELTPHRCLISNFPLGKKIDISQFTGKAFKLSNQSEQKYAFSLTVNSSTENSDLEISNYQVGNINFLSFDTGEIIVEPQKSKKFYPYLLIPDERKYRNKGFVFIIKAEVLGQIPEQSKFGIIIVKTGGK